jgi:hypothetical protein
MGGTHSQDDPITPTIDTSKQHVLHVAVGLYMQSPNPYKVQIIPVNVTPSQVAVPEGSRFLWTQNTISIDGCRFIREHKNFMVFYGNGREVYVKTQSVSGGHHPEINMAHPTIKPVDFQDSDWALVGHAYAVSDAQHERDHPRYYTPSTSHDHGYSASSTPIALDPRFQVTLNSPNVNR